MTAELDASPEAWCLRDCGRVVWFNKAAKQLLGLKDHYMALDDFAALVGTDHGASEAALHPFKPGECHVIEVPLKEKRVLLVRRACQCNNGGLVVVTRIEEA